MVGKECFQFQVSQKSILTISRDLCVGLEWERTKIKTHSKECLEVQRQFKACAQIVTRNVGGPVEIRPTRHAADIIGSVVKSRLLWVGNKAITSGDVTPYFFDLPPLTVFEAFDLLFVLLIVFLFGEFPLPPEVSLPLGSAPAFFCFFPVFDVCFFEEAVFFFGDSLFEEVFVKVFI